VWALFATHVLQRNIRIVMSIKWILPVAFRRIVRRSGSPSLTKLEVLTSLFLFVSLTVQRPRHATVLHVWLVLTARVVLLLLSSIVCLIIVIVGSRLSTSDIIVVASTTTIVGSLFRFVSRRVTTSATVVIVIVIPRWPIVVIISGTVVALITLIVFRCVSVFI